jgi:hypothetical protein
MPQFERYIGIDYSGAVTSESSCKGLRVYVAEGSGTPEQIQPPSSPRLYWTRRGLAEWLCNKLADDIPTLVGIVPHRLLRPLPPSPRLAELLARFPESLADARAEYVCGLHPGRPYRGRREVDAREHLAPSYRTVDADREIRLPIRRAGLGRQINVRRSTLAPLLAKLVQAASPFLAVRRLGDSRGQIGGRGGLPGSVDASF